MFTGIIKYQGIVKNKTTSSLSLEAGALFMRELSVGASVAVNGVCLTISKIQSKKIIIVDVMPETLKKTMLGNLKVKDVVNLELPLKANEYIGGHIVQGHVDGTAVIKTIQKVGNSRIFHFTASKKLLASMVEKGSVAINGVSLTLIEVTDRGFTVGIIPHTWSHTTFRYAKVGDKVNIETDILAKYANPFPAVAYKNVLKKNKDIRIAIVSSLFRREVSRNLEKNCLATFKRRGIKKSQVTIVGVPGSLEIPLIVKKLAKKNIYDAIITFGAIYKGNTYHFEQIANECIRGCMDVSLEYEVPVIFEVLAVYDPKDAIERATRKKENKGVEAALTALAMIKIISKL